MQLSAAGGFMHYLFLLCLTSGLFGSSVNTNLSDNWYQVQTPHFEVISNTDVKRVRQLAYDLEKSRAILAAIYPENQAMPGKPVRVVMIRNLQSFLRWRGSLAKQAKNFYTNGLYRETPTAHYIIMNTFRTRGGTKRTLELALHEVMHLHNQANYRDMPLWIDEAMAEYYSRSEVLRRAVDVGFLQRDHVYELRASRMMPLDDLFKTRHHSKNYRKVLHMSNFYSQSWAFYHFLKQDPEALEKRMLDTYLGLLREGMDGDAATDQIFQNRKAMRERFQTYVDKIEFEHERLHIRVPKQTKDYKVRPMSLANAHAFAASFFTGMKDFAYAEAHLEKARSLGADPVALAKAEALFYSSQGRTLEAVTASDAVLEATKGTSVESHFLKGTILSLGRATWGDAEHHLKEAIRLDPDFAPAYSQLGLVKSFSLDRSLAGEIESLMAKGISLERGDHEHYLRQAQARVNLGNYEAALAVAGPLLKAIERPEIVRSARNLIALIEELKANRKAVETSSNQL